MLAELSKPIIITMAVFVGLNISTFIMLLLCYRKVPQGKALVRNGFSGLKVTFNGKIVIPLLHKAEFVDVTYKRILVDCISDNAFITKDNVQINVLAAFFVRINNTEEDVIRVVQDLGCENASKIEVIADLFSSKFREKLRDAARQFNYIDLDENRMAFGKRVMGFIDKNLNGYILENVIIENVVKMGNDV